jgi:hypothetical protein
MSQIEYLVVLIAIVVGLGVTDLAESIRDLLHPGRPVRWHWLPLTWCLIVVLTVVSAWWGFSLFLQARVWRSPFAFLLIFFLTLSLYLLCAFALPDLDGPPQTEGADMLDLEAFYFSSSHRRAFFGVALTFTLLFWGTVSLWKTTTMEVPPQQVARSMVVNALCFALPYGTLLYTEQKWIHAVLTVIVFGLTIWLFIEFGPLLATE